MTIIGEAVVLGTVAFLGSVAGYLVMHYRHRKQIANLGLPQNANVQVLGDRSHIWPDVTSRIKELTEARYNVVKGDVSDETDKLRAKLDEAIDKLLPHVGK